MNSFFMQHPLDSFPGLTMIAFAVILLTTVVVLLSLIVVAHHIVTDRQRYSNRERFEAGAISLAPHLVSGGATLSAAVGIARKKSGDRAVALVLRRARYDLLGPVRDKITNLLESTGEVDKLISEFASRRDWRRSIAIRGLGECGGEKARKALITASTDVSGDVRRAAREGLLADGSPEALKAAIASFIADLPRRAGWRRSFYARLAIVGSAELTELIRTNQLVGTEEKLALEALGDASAPSALQLALERVGSEEGETRATAVRVIGKVGGERELPLLLEGLRDPEWFVRAAAARGIEWALTLRSGVRQLAARQAAAEALGYCLIDSSWWVRANAARALARIGDAGVTVLLRNIDSTDRYARDASIAAIAMAPLPPSTRMTIKARIDSMLAPPAPTIPIKHQPRAGGLFA